MGNRKISGKLAKPWRIAVIAFGLAYVLALFVYLIGVYGWFGVTKDPLAGAILAVLGLPWNLVNEPLPSRHESPLGTIPKYHGQPPLTLMPGRSIWGIGGLTFGYAQPTMVGTQSGIGMSHAHFRASR